ncbi:two-component system response regulator [Candidatus Atribacteria bacterium HGW-Atribacteria-1]|nr:MAG: two-component system response regulator [Candidatus Atribacteria bacterium HGW-Atribacteria-1]
MNRFPKKKNRRKRMKKELHLLILEDNPADAELAVRELKKEGFVVKWSLVDTEEAFREALNQRPEVILADYNLPSFDGLSALKIKQVISPTIPLIIISGAIGEELATECIKIGATDYVLKDKLFRLGPVVKRALKEAEEHRERKQAEKELKQSYEKLQKIMEGTINAIGNIVETRDPYTAGHQKKVSQLATFIAQEMKLPQDKIEGIRISSLVHDIGKISIPAEILSKPTKLNEIEYSLIKDHSQIGYDILKNIDFLWPVAQIVLQHHERLDGSGYPQSLKGNDILLEAKIMGVADVVEAMSSRVLC